MTKKRRALYTTLYAIGITVSVSLIYIFRYDANVHHILWVLGGHSNLAALISMPADFLIGGCVGFTIVNFALRDDITQHFPWLKGKQPRIILYTLGVTAALYYLYPWASLYFLSRSLPSGSYWGIPLGLAMMFTAGCMGFAIVSLLLRDYAEQSILLLKRKPLLIGFYILGTIGGLSLVGLPLVVFYVGTKPLPFGGTLLPMLVQGFYLGMPGTLLATPVIGGCIGLATMSIVLRDDLTEHFTFLRRKGFRAAFYIIGIASSCWPSVSLALLLAFFSGVISFLPTVTTIGGCIGFAAASIILRGNLRRNLSITGIIVGVGMVILLEVGIMSLLHPYSNYPG